MSGSDTVSTADLRRMLELVETGRTETSGDVMPGSVLAGLARLVSADWACFSELDLIGRRVLRYRDTDGGTAAGVTEQEVDSYFRTRHEHPLCHVVEHRQRRPPVVAVSDLVSLPELRRRRIYVERFADNGTDDELHLPLPTGAGRTRVFIFGRAGYGFTEREHLMCLLVQPHLLDLYRQRTAQLTPTPPVTPRERDVLEGVAGGLTDAEIAARLAISAGTVRKHLDNVFTRLGVSTRTAAVAVAIHAEMDG